MADAPAQRRQRGRRLHHVHVLDVPAVFPQSNLLLAIPIAAALALPFNLLYGMFASIMPRTGSEYVFLSRTFHPAIGFMASFAAAMSQAFWVGIGGYWIAQFVLGPLFSSYGLASGNQTIADIGAWANEPTTWFIFGTVFIVLMAGLNIRGLRAYLRFQDINWIIGAVTGILLLLVFFMATTTAFQSGFDKYAAAAGIPGYEQTLTLAKDGGMPTGLSIVDTLGIIPIIWLIAWASTYLGGEVRTPTKTQLRATVGGMLLYAGIALVLFFAISGPVTVQFNQALTWLSYNPPPDTTVEAYPVFMLYAGVLIDNLLVFLPSAPGSSCGATSGCRRRCSSRPGRCSPGRSTGSSPRSCPRSTRSTTRRGSRSSWWPSSPRRS